MFSLAGHLGMTVAEVGERVDSQELSEWSALLSIEPWGQYRLDLLNAISAYASAAPWCKNTKVSDWMPTFGDAKKVDHEAMLLGLQALGGVLRHGNCDKAGD